MSRTPAPQDERLKLMGRKPVFVRAQYRFLRGKWVEVLDGDAPEFREMARVNPETWQTDEGPHSKGRTGPAFK